jgi:hypothetical protein
MITVLFPRTSSASFDEALFLCSGLNNFQQIEINDCTWFELKLSKRSIPVALKALHVIRRLKGKRVVVEGVNSAFASVFGFLDCYTRKFSEGHPKDYCFGSEEEGNANLYGCRMTCRVEIDCIGSVNASTGRWTFNKREMKRQLTSTLSPCEHCPSFKSGFAHNVVDAHPASVNPDLNPQFKFVDLTIPLPSMPTQIVNKPDRYGTKRRYVRGVRIIGHDALDMISRKVKRRIPHGVLLNNVFTMKL